MRAKIYYLVSIILYLQIITLKGQLIQNVTSKASLVKSEERKSTPNNFTTGELIVKQTESIKKIVADQNQQASTIDYPITNSEPNYSEEAKKQIEKLSIEELKIQCQHFSKLFQTNKTNTSTKPSIPYGANSNQNILSKPSNHKPYNSQSRPVYIQPKTTFKPKYFTTQKPNGFYITQSTATPKPATNTQQPPIKYIRLEPVILQKTILSDGRTVYYWHRSLPTAVEIASDVTPKNDQISSATYQEYPAYNNLYGQPPISNNYNNFPYGYSNTLYRYAPWSQYPYVSNNYVPTHQNAYTPTEGTLEERQKSSEPTTESSTTSTTEQVSYGYGLRSFLPFYSYGQEVTTTTTEPTTTTTSTTPSSTTEKLKTDDLLYAQQLKFIIPVPYEDLNGGTSVSARHPWGFDPYAYYPKELQPNTVNVEIPYKPTFHMIRAVAVPSDSKINGEINK